MKHNILLYFNKYKYTNDFNLNSNNHCIINSAYINTILHNINIGILGTYFDNDIIVDNALFAYTSKEKDNSSCVFYDKQEISIITKKQIYKNLNTPIMLVSADNILIVKSYIYNHDLNQIIGCCGYNNIEEK